MNFLSAWLSAQKNRIEGGFARSVAVLVGGTALAQALTVVALPALTRLYGPGEFGVLAIYASVLGTLSVIACLRFEVAIPLPEDEREAVALLAISLCASLVLAAACAAAILLYPGSVMASLRMPQLEPYQWLIPIGVWLAGSYAALQYWATRKRQFRTIAQTRVLQGLGGAGTQLALGFALAASPFGLLFGHMISAGAGVARLLRSAWSEAGPLALTLQWAEVKRTACKYRRFPTYSMPEALANSAGIQVPVILIAVLSAGPLAGMLFVAQRVLSAPMLLISGSVAQVYLAHATDHKRSGTLGEFTASTIEGLGKVAAGPIIALGIVSPTLTATVFGTSWVAVGKVIFYLTPWIVMQLLTSPVSMALHVTDNQRTALLLQLFGLFIRVGSVLAAGLLLRGGIIEAYAASGFLFYFVYILAIKRVTGMAARRLLAVFTSILPFASAWILAALLFNYVFGHFIGPQNHY